MTIKLCNNKQKQIIHTLLSRLKIDDDLYREMLAQRFPKQCTKDMKYSCSYLSEMQANKFIWELQGYLKQQKYKPYDELKGRPGMAKPEQLRMISALWSQVSRQKSQKDKQKALRKFLEHHFHIASERWIEDWMVGKIIYTLKIMLKDKTIKEEAK